MEFSGRLSAFPPANLLQWASQERRTGALVVRRTRGEKRVYFRDGSVVACLSSDPSEHLGQYLLLHGRLEEPAFLRALRHCEETGRRLGAALVELGLLDQRQVEDSQHGRIVDAVCDLFLWPKGVFFFHAEPPPDDEIPPRPIDTMGLVMEGTRWVDELARIRRVFVHDHVVLRRGPVWAAPSLGPLERRICAAVDGVRGLGAVHAVVRGSYYRFVEAAYALCLREVLDIATVVEIDEPVSTEIRVLDLLLEQTAEEEKALIAERRRAIPLAALTDLYPAWTGPPPGGEALGADDSAAHALAAFHARLDGRTTLGDALSPDPDLRERELELFEVALARGRLALLPAPAEDLAPGVTGTGGGEGWWRRLMPG
jgi:hypothetical protein